MKGRMLPWWVRKRSQEKSSAVDASAASSAQSLRLYQSGSKAKTLNKDVEVSPAASLHYTHMPLIIARQVEPCMPCAGGASGGQRRGGGCSWRQCTSDR